jgi:hypothetical protein
VSDKCDKIFKHKTKTTMKLSKAVIKEVKRMIAYYRYAYLKQYETLIKVFRVRWDEERVEVYLNQLDEVLSNTTNQTILITNLFDKHNFDKHKDLLLLVGIKCHAKNGLGKIALQDDGTLFIYHNKPAKVNKNLVEIEKNRNTYFLVEGNRAKQCDSKPTAVQY